MLALIKYMLIDLHRSNRYFMPTVFYGLVVLWMYSVRPNPVLESYSVTAALAFGCALWFGFMAEGAEARVQRELTMLHAGGWRRYAWGRMLVLGIWGAAFSLWGTLVPVAAGAFVRNPSAAELILALYSHLVSFLLGAFISWLLAVLGGNPRSRLVMAMVLLALALAAGGMESALPDWAGWLTWLLPPAYRLMHVLVKYPSMSSGAAAFWFLYPAAYAGLLLLPVLKYLPLQGSR
ncbi:MAG: hypothetical protein K0Q90_3487 [Paenibacillaceae bacterium]|nr:hypothetical protein [Paenibacillaceae bacterium]